MPPDPKEREAWARLPFDEKEYTEKEMGARELARNSVKSENTTKIAITDRREKEL